MIVPISDHPCLLETGSIVDAVGNVVEASDCISDPHCINSCFPVELIRSGRSYVMCTRLGLRLIMYITFVELCLSGVLSDRLLLLSSTRACLGKRLKFRAIF